MGSIKAFQVAVASALVLSATAVGWAATAPPASAASSSAVYVSFQTGNDTSGTGSSAAPYQSLTQALANVAAGGTVYLTGTDDEWTGSTGDDDGVTIGKNVTIVAAPGASATLKGQGATAEGGALITIGGAYTVTLDDLTLTDAESSTAGSGGAITNGAGGTLTIGGSTFSDDATLGSAGGGAIANGYGSGGTGTLTITGSSFRANQESAIANGIEGGNGTLAVEDSTFSDNSATSGLPFGGAIDNGGYGEGALTVRGSTFTGNTASESGGAIASGDPGSEGASLSVTASTFSGNTATGDGGGAIAANADGSPAGNVTVSASSFTNNSALNYGGAIESDSEGSGGTLAVSGSTFDGNSVTGTSPGFGGAIDVGSSTGLTTTLTVTGSTFYRDASAAYGGAINNGGSSGGKNTLSVAQSTFTGNAAASGGDVIASTDDEAPGGTVVDVAADVFAGSCYSGTTTTSTAWSDAGDNAGTDTSCFPAGTTHDVIAASVGDDLSPLGSFGGPLPTVLVETGDPALGLVPVGTTVTLNGASTKLCPTIDERDVASLAGRTCNAGAVQQSLPAISARVTHRGRKSRYGWWDGPVTISFTCSDPVPLVASCPRPVTFKSRAKAQRITRTITGIDGGTAAAAAGPFKVDTSKPKVKITGVRKGHTYRGKAPKAKCSGSDRYSGIASCKLTSKKKKRHGMTTITYTAKATSKAGRTARTSFSVKVKPR